MSDAPAPTGPVRAFVTAVRFLTRLPIPGTPGNLRAALVYFPLVGALIGLGTAGVVLAASRFWPIWVAVLLALAWEGWLTGALHEDALADFCDAFGGGWNRDDVLRILGDSRLGTYGVLGLGLATLLRLGAMAALSLGDLLVATVAAATWGRTVILVVLWLVPPLPDRASAARDAGTRLGAGGVLAGLFWCLPGVVPLAWFRPVHAGAALGATLLFLAWLTPYLHRRLGGSTGDCLGFACCIAQLLVLLAVCAAPQ